MGLIYTLFSRIDVIGERFIRGSQTVLFLLSVVFIFSVTTPLNAQQLGIQVQFWSSLGGDFYESDLEERFFKDDLYRGQAATIEAGKYNLAFINGDQFALPVSLYYNPGFLRQLRIEASYYSVSANLFYHGFSDAAAPSRIHLNEMHGFERSSYSGGLSYAFLGFWNSAPYSLLLLRAGVARETQSFNFRTLVFGTSGGGVTPGDDFWDASASGMYLGAEIEIPLAGNWSFSAAYRRSDSLSGNMRYNIFEVTPSSSGFLYNLEKIEAGYKLRRDIQQVGLNYYVTADFRFSFGFRRAVYHVRYPGYFSYSISNTSQNQTFQLSPALEIITDSLMFYPEVKKERIGNMYFGFEKVFDFSGDDDTK